MCSSDLWGAERNNMVHEPRRDGDKQKDVPQKTERERMMDKGKER